MTGNLLSERIRKWAARFAQREDQVAIVLSLVVGALVGLVVVAFILLTGRMAARMYPPGSSPWRSILIPVFGSLVSGYLLYRYFPDARGSGIPQAKYALFLHNGYISLKTVVGKFLCCSLTLASGIALGREGPSVQIGAGITSVLARRFGLKTEQVKGILPAGCAAALAAAFNTPIAAVLFSLEEILGDMHAPVLGSVVVSAATSWIVLHLILGDEPLFHVPPYQLVNPSEFGIYAVLGLVGGLGSVAFVKILLGLRVWFRRLPKSTVWLQPVAGGLTVGLLALAAPEVMGVGYDFVERVLSGGVAFRIVALLAVLKILATAMSYSSGNAGGIFGPTLFIGAMMGGAVGSAAHALFPATTAGPGAYALVGMGAAFAGIVRTPLTSVIMIFEMTRDYSIIVPLMISNLVSFVVSYQFQRQPIYEALALQEGVYLPSREEVHEQLERHQVEDIVRKDMQPLPPTMNLDAARRVLEEARLNAWPVATQGHLSGLLTAHTLHSRQDLSGAVHDVMNPAAAFPFVHADESLAVALERMGAAGVDVLPVVSRSDLRLWLGTVTLGDVLKAYGVGATQ
ncbi:MAG TPA: chloride channel protein [Bryobacteraceae bacterium]|nr:chloride channel protein [Bryobacteraceae bacterium]